MILGIEIENFDVFDKDRAGILLDDYLSDILKGYHYPGMCRGFHKLRKAGFCQHDS